MKKYFSKQQAIFLGILFLGPLLYGVMIITPKNNNDFIMELGSNLLDIPVPPLPPSFEMNKSEIFGMWLGLSFFSLLAIMFTFGHLSVKKGGQPLLPEL